MTQRTKKLALLALVGITLGVGVGLYYYWPIRTVSGTLTDLKVETRQAWFEFPHPKSGKVIEISVTVPPDCPIELDGQLVQLSDLEIGDRATVRAMWLGKKDIRIRHVTVERSQQSAASRRFRKSATTLTVPAGPMLQQITPDSAILVWYYPDGPSATVSIQPAAPATTSAPAADQSDTSTSAAQQFSVTPQEGRYEARLTHLNSGVNYQYLIQPAAGDFSKLFTTTGTFRTAPPAGTPFRIVAFGDSGTALEGQNQLAKLIPPYQPDLVIHSGDLINPTGAMEDYPSKFFTPYADLLARIAFYPTIGNHDYDTYHGDPLCAIFTLPDNGPSATISEHHYWFDYGDVRFVGIDTNEPFTTLRDQVAPWLEQLLADAGDRWKIVYFHHPPYTHGKYAPSGKVRNSLVPIFDRQQVDLVINGHNHMYERSHPIRNGAVVTEDQGTVYVVSAGGGSEIYQIPPDPPDYLVMQNNKLHSFSIIDVTSQQLTFRQIGADNQLMDTFIIKRSHHGPDPELLPDTRDDVPPDPDAP
ncbi:MAG: 3',5'-cyclic adenosine monophosphate phosphodiesterase CpdA [Phycisphaerae bacterium]|nr:3',5'-cyclic adenosine monophosphate phosphodiesterase CpdA [Phycisphaerae bacterium]